jgi:hypothetical protein
VRDEVAAIVAEVDDLIAYDVPTSTETAVSPAEPATSGTVIAVADRIELSAVNPAADTTVTAPVDVRVDSDPAKFAEARDDCAPPATNVAAAVAVPLPDDTSRALTASAENADSAHDACTTLSPLAATSIIALAASTAEPSATCSAVPVIDDSAMSGTVAKVPIAPLVVSAATAARLHELAETPMPVAVSVDNAAGLADPELTSYPIATSAVVAARDDGVAATRTESVESAADPETISMAGARKVAPATRCSVPSAIPSPLTVCVDVATRLAVPNAELAAVRLAIPFIDEVARAVCVTAAVMVRVVDSDADAEFTSACG